MTKLLMQAAQAEKPHGVLGVLVAILSWLASPAVLGTMPDHWAAVFMALGAIYAAWGYRKDIVSDVKQRTASHSVFGVVLGMAGWLLSPAVTSQLPEKYAAIAIGLGGLWAAWGFTRDIKTAKK